MALPRFLAGVFPIPFLLLAACAGPPAESRATVAPAPVALEQESVKPGINDSFLDPDLDVDRMVQRFEGESREVFAERQAIAEATGLRRGDAVADIGAGTGLFTELFADAVGPEGKVYAVDISPAFVAHLRRRVAARGLRQVEPVQCTDRSANLPPESIDVAFICDTYHHFEYPRTTMTSIREALRPGGTVVIVDFERIPGVSRDWILDHVRCGKETVIEEVESVGFDKVEEVPIPGLEENYLLRFRKR